MDLHILFIQRREDYPEQYAPEALVVWDEYAVEENSEGFDEACEKAIKFIGTDLLAHRVIRVRVDQESIRKKLIGTPVVAGEIVES